MISVMGFISPARLCEMFTNPIYTSRTRSQLRISRGLVAGAIAGKRRDWKPGVSGYHYLVSVRLGLTQCPNFEAHYIIDGMIRVCMKKKKKKPEAKEPVSDFLGTRRDMERYVEYHYFLWFPRLRYPSPQCRSQDDTVI